MTRPVIGITTYNEPASWGAWVSVPAAQLQWAYIDKVQRAGGRVVLLPPDDVDTDIVARLDGLVLTGGADVDARLYGEQPHATADVPRELRDASEIALYRAAMARGLPVLGICRGLQVMAVAEGGALHQHLFDVVGDWSHREVPGTFVSHAARFADGSGIAAILGAGLTEVNSSHHQAVRDAGRLTVTGWAHDGTVEVCEDPARPFVVGVQWHPEMLDDLRLFSAFVDACRA